MESHVCNGLVDLWFNSSYLLGSSGLDITSKLENCMYAIELLSYLVH